MFYTVFNCHNQSEIYEEREYKCFGQWKEEDGLIYTYTERVDIPGNECFVGVTIDQDKNMVSEAGQNCERGHQPKKYGMTLHRQAKCPHELKKQTVQISVEREEENRLDTLIVTDRAVSPRLSTVLSTASPTDSQNNRQHVKKHHKHIHSTSDRTISTNVDILSNEIPGSALPSAVSGTNKISPGTIVLLVVLMVIHKWM